jgi:hypothetical protein
MDKIIGNEEVIKYLGELCEDNPKDPKTPWALYYLEASGQELNKKFWSKRSSSRLCFDLFRDIADLKSVKSFQFEKILPGLASRGKNPNMDVYFETEKEIVFIESKFSEKASYICKSKKKGDKGLSKAYWCKDGYGKPLKDRYHNCDFEEEFVDFIDDIEKKAEELRKNSKTKTNPQEWFDIKQETCHLLGILFYIFKNDIKDKKISFYNVYWEFKEDKSKIADKFMPKAEGMVKNILKERNLEFQYKAITTQKFLEGGSKTIIEGLQLPTIKKRIGLYEELSKGKTRKEMKNI